MQVFGNRKRLFITGGRKINTADGNIANIICRNICTYLAQRCLAVCRCKRCGVYSRSDWLNVFRILHDADIISLAAVGKKVKVILQKLQSKPKFICLCLHIRCFHFAARHAAATLIPVDNQPDLLIGAERNTPRRSSITLNFKIKQQPVTQMNIFTHDQFAFIACFTFHNEAVSVFLYIALKDAAAVCQRMKIIPKD